MLKENKKISLVYFVLGALLFVALVPLGILGWLLSGRSEQELRSVESRYQVQLVQDKARQIEMFGQRYSDLIGNLAKNLEFSSDSVEAQLQETIKNSPNLVSLSIKPVNGQSINIARPGEITEEEIANLSNSVLADLDESSLAMTRPKILASNQTALTIAAPIFDKVDKTKVLAALIGVVSCREITRILEHDMKRTEAEMLQLGLPIVFVVDQEGKAIFHPNSQLARNQTLMTDLKIVEDWELSGRQIQSALSPFTVERDGKKENFLGTYATVNLSPKMMLGVIAIQNEGKALASVGEMRQQTWLISLISVAFALVVGFLFTRGLTKPVLEIVRAAKQIEEGDLSTRIQSHHHTELGNLSRSFNSMTSELEKKIEELKHAANENRELFIGTVKALAAAIDGKDRYTRGHSERVSRFSVAIGQRLKLPEQELEKLRLSALLHDVGKIGIDDNILKKPAALTDEEFEIMKTHPQKGFKIMANIPAMKDFLPGMYMHHEMIDGKGYPQGLKDHEIPMQARIVSVADTFDAMTTDRPYSKGMSVEAAVERIRSFVGTRYDSRVVEALAKACEEGQIRAGSVSLRPKPAAVKVPETAQAENTETAAI